MARIFNIYFHKSLPRATPIVTVPRRHRSMSVASPFLTLPPPKQQFTRAPLPCYFLYVPAFRNSEASRAFLFFLIFPTKTLPRRTSSFPIIFRASTPLARDTCHLPRDGGSEEKRVTGGHHAQQLDETKHLPLTKTWSSQLPQRLLSN